jgi:glycogen synthase
VIPNGRAVVDQMDDVMPIKSDVVFAAGRLWDEAKNIAALSSIAHHLSWRVAIAGDFGGTHPVVSPANVTWLGPLGSPAMMRWYSRAAIYAAPALYEPFGLSTLEAAASGCALVLGDIPSLRENWSAAALFVDPRDPQALASAIQGAIDDPNGRRRLALRAMARARHYTVARMAHAYVDAYHHVLSDATVAQS